MKDISDKLASYNRIEFWAATTIFVFVIFFHITDAVTPEWSSNYGQSGVQTIPFSYYFVSKLVQYVVLYASFLLLNFKVVPKLIRNENVVLNIFLLALTFAVVGFVFGVTDTYLKNYLFRHYKTIQDTYNFIFRNSFLYAAWLLLVFGFYSIIRYVGLYLISHATAIHLKYRMITPGGLVASVVWMVSLFLLLIGKADRVILAMWFVLIPFGILLYWYSFYSLIPKSLPKKRPFLNYLARVILVLTIAVFPVGFLIMLLIQNGDGTAAISSFNIAFQLLITAPLSWVLFKRFVKGNKEIYDLKKELGQSHASMDFLRSQINPHFLFNALNTIYGTAIQEKAERTSEGIEKLGEMMRFMLQENMQDKIALSREIDYLNNYISLQKLRTDTNPCVRIEAVIEQPVTAVQIAPMLLIPFVENAFKHGISLRAASHIKISLELKEKTLYFDVYNSKHIRQDNDPEKNKSGIGLNNVKQRLLLLYPNRHELLIRENAKEFFVHLTLQLA